MSSFSITASTAPGTTFTSRASLASHYKSDWHRYNLKRKENNMTPVDLLTFNARVAAALALKKEKEEKKERGGKDHLKGDNKISKKQENKEKKAMKEITEEGGNVTNVDVDEGKKTRRETHTYSLSLSFQKKYLTLSNQNKT